MRITPITYHNFPESLIGNSSSASVINKLLTQLTIKATTNPMTSLVITLIYLLFVNFDRCANYVIFNAYFFPIKSKFNNDWDC